MLGAKTRKETFRENRVDYETVYTIYRKAERLHSTLIENINTVNKQYNQPIALIFDKQNIYIGTTEVQLRSKKILFNRIKILQRKGQPEILANLITIGCISLCKGMDFEFLNTEDGSYGEKLNYFRQEYLLQKKIIK